MGQTEIETSRSLARTMSVLAVLIAALALAGCAQRFEADAGHPVGSIAVIGPENPEYYTLRILHYDVGSDVFTSVLRSQHLLFGTELNQAVSAALVRDGYTVVNSGTSVGVTLPDARLSFEIAEIGYERRIWGPVGPHIFISATLTDTASGHTLFSRTYGYDAEAQTLGYTILRPEDRFGFDTPRGALDRPDVSAEGLRAAIPMIAADIAASLRRP